MAAILWLACTAVRGHAGADVTARDWAAGCAACHGPDGRSADGIPSIAGRSAEDLYNILLAFKNGTREATVMHQLTRGYTDDQLRRIAEAWSSTPP